MIDPRPGRLGLVLLFHHRLPSLGMSVGADWACRAVEYDWPTLLAIESAVSKSPEHGLTVAVSPAWTALANDPVAQSLVRWELVRRAEEAPGEAERARRRHLNDQVLGRLRLDAVGLLSRLARSGAIELVAAAASHAWLPNFESSRVFLNAAVGAALNDHARAYGLASDGFVCPFGGVFPTLDRVVARFGARYQLVEADTLTRGGQTPPGGCAGVLIASTGVASLGIDPVPTAPLIDPDQPGVAWLEDAGDPVETRSDGPHPRTHAHDHPYPPRWSTSPSLGILDADSDQLAAALAEGFLARWATRVDHESKRLHPLTPDDPPPLGLTLVSARDLGGRFAVGAGWLGHVLTKLGRREISPALTSRWRGVTPGRFLDDHPAAVLGRPGPSLGEWWSVRPGDSNLVEECRRAADRLAERLETLAPLLRPASRQPNDAVIIKRILACMTKQMLLAASIDWSSRDGHDLPQRVALNTAFERLDAFAELDAMLSARRVDLERLDALNSGPAFLPDLDLDALMV